MYPLISIALKRSLSVLLLNICAIVAMAQGMIVLDLSNKDVTSGRGYKKCEFTEGTVHFVASNYIQSKGKYGQIKKETPITLTINSGQFYSVEIIYDGQSAPSTPYRRYETKSFGDAGKGKYDPISCVWTANEGETVTTLTLINSNGPTYIDSIIINARSYKLELSERGYATLALDYNYRLPSSLKASAATAVDGENIAFDWKYKSGAIIPANTPLLVKGIKGTYNIRECAAKPQEAPASNLFVGNTTVESVQYTHADRVYYALGEGTDGGYGFYKVDDEGHSITLPAHRCALVLTATSALVPAFLTLDGMLTAVSQVARHQESEANIYNLQGQKVGTTSQWQVLPRGLYIVNGQKIMK